MAIAPEHGASWGNNMALSDYNRDQLTAARDFVLGNQNNLSTVWSTAAKMGLPVSDVTDLLNWTQFNPSWTAQRQTYTPQGVSSAMGVAPPPPPPPPPPPSTFKYLPPSMQPVTLSNPSTYRANPYLGQMSNAITSQVTDNLQRNILPGLGSAAVGAGGYGGSRQGVLEANALRDANQGLSNSLANMYYGDYNNAMNRQLQQYGMDQGYNLGLGNLNLGMQNSLQNYNLGLGNLALGNQNSMQNFYSTQRGQDMQQMQLGANLFNMGNQGMLGQGQFLYNLGLTQQQAPWQVMGNYTNTLSPFTGYGSTSGNPFAGAIGGALTGAQLYNIFNG